FRAGPLRPGVSGKRTVADAPVRGRRVLVRVDFNVPQLANGQVADDRRITEAMPTIEHLRAHGAKTVLMTHLGRPEGRRDPRYSLRPVVHRVSALLGQPVGLAEDIVGYQAIEAVARMNPGDVL
ncbi:phosphoglycerate kinase, partial [mine drainage metagenome]